MTGTERLTHAQRAEMIRDLNDAFRKDLRGGQLLLSSGIMEKSGDGLADLLLAISDFDHFNEDNDPFGEHDFARMSWRGDPIFWKIDYLDAEVQMGSPDPADPDLTTRVLTVMMAWEY
jgi:hypothetical protein